MCIFFINSTTCQLTILHQYQANHTPYQAVPLNQDSPHLHLPLSPSPSRTLLPTPKPFPYHIPNLILWLILLQSCCQQPQPACRSHLTRCLKYLR